ncbi:MAG: hypothetical protein ACOVP4_07690 [Bacteriovoracaceae bacterium]|jgi:hypothetical protein
MMNWRKLLTQFGQTSVEYLLMLSVAIAMGLTFTKKFEEYLLTNPDSYINKHMKIYDQSFRDPLKAYKTFSFPR